MEPSDLKPTPPDDALEAWLQRSAALPPLPDDGFSSRVMATLPPPRRARSAQRLWFCLAGALAGGALAAFKMATAANLAVSLPDLSPALDKLADPRLAVGLAVTTATLVLVFWNEVRRQVQHYRHAIGL